MLGEVSTTEIAGEHNAQGFEENLSIAHAGGAVAGNARRDLESKTSKKVLDKGNCLSKNEETQS